VSLRHNKYVQFDLEHLGWKNFQDLALTIAGHMYGLTVTEFSIGPDGGRDGTAFAFYESSDWGEVVIQAKHTSSPDPLRFYHIKDEVKKINDLVIDGQCGAYMFITNRPVSAKVEATIRKNIGALGVKKTIVVGRETIMRYLTEDKDLRGLLPRVYGLGDLSEILDERLYLQTKALVLNDDIERFVATTPYFSTLDALERQGFVLLLGEPAAGKTSIMRAAAIHAADRWGLSPLWLTSMSELRTHWNTFRDDQLFLVDDVFGSVNFDPEQAELWNKSIPFTRAAIDRGSKFILTSRDYVFAGAKSLIKRDELPVAREGEVVIEVEKLKLQERRQIVYNHLRMGNQDLQFKRSLKPHLAEITHNPRLLPEVARRLGDSNFTKNLDPADIHAVKQFVDEPREYLLGLVDSLSPPLQAALVVMLASGGCVASPAPPTTTIWQRLNMGQSQLGQALEQLDGSLVRHLEVDDRWEWRPRHPTVLDAASDWLMTRRDMVDLYVNYAPFESAARHVSCGARVRGSLNIPEELWPSMFERVFNGCDQSLAAIRFLAYRCSTRALRQSGHLSEIAELVSSAGFRSPLDSDPSTQMLLRLAVDNLMDREVAHELMWQLIDHAIESFDPYCLSNPVIEEVLSDLTGGDAAWLRVIDRYVQAVTVNLPDYVQSQIRNHLGDISRIDMFADVQALMYELGNWVADGSPASVVMEQQVEHIRAWVAEDLDILGDRRSGFERMAKRFVAVVSGPGLDGQRFDTGGHIFSDVDDS
jgi:hypothetical protein